MPSPPITLYMTTIASNPKLRSQQEYILRILQVKKIPYTAYDLASDPDAKRVWRRTAPANKQQLPGILVGQRFMGTAAEFEDAVEHDELTTFLRLNETWDPDLSDERPAPAAKIVGIPGAMTPQEMTPEHLKSRLYPGGSAASPGPSPLKGKGKVVPVNKRTDELDLGEDLGEFGLEGVKVTKDELADLIAELGLGGAGGDGKDGKVEKGLDGSAGLSGSGSASVAPLKTVKTAPLRLGKGKSKGVEAVTKVEEKGDEKTVGEKKPGETPADEVKPIIKEEDKQNSENKATDGKVTDEPMSVKEEKEKDEEPTKAVETKAEEKPVDVQKDVDVPAAIVAADPKAAAGDGKDEEQQKEAPKKELEDGKEKEVEAKP